MKQTVVGVFDRYESARHAANLLADSGFAPDAVQVAGDEESLREEGRESGLMERVRSFFAEVFGSSGEAPEHEHMSQYAEAVRRGGGVVRVDVEDEPRVDAARQVLESAGAVDIDRQVAAWREEGWRGEMAAGDFARTREAGALGPHASAGTDRLASDAGTIGTVRADAHAEALAAPPLGDAPSRRVRIYAQPTPAMLEREAGLDAPAGERSND